MPILLEIQKWNSFTSLLITIDSVFLDLHHSAFSCLSLTSCQKSSFIHLPIFGLPAGSKATSKSGWKMLFRSSSHAMEGIKKRKQQVLYIYIYIYICMYHCYINIEVTWTTWIFDDCRLDELRRTSPTHCTIPSSKLLIKPPLWKAWDGVENDLYGYFQK